MVRESLKNKVISLSFFGILLYGFKESCYQQFIEWQGRREVSEEFYRFILENKVDLNRDGIISAEEKSLFYKLLDDCRESPSEARWETLSPPYSSKEELGRLHCAIDTYSELKKGKYFIDIF